MAICVNFVDGAFAQVQSSIEECTAYVLVTSTEYESMFDSFTLDAETVAYAFSFGMGAIITCYLASYPIGAVRRMILDDCR